jgi:ParB family transcriptional regulator, chromosome partitioning protein
MTRKALGRGLGALLSAEKTAGDGEEFLEIDVELIDPSPVQPRMHFDERALDELSKSIRANGIVQPLLVRRKGARYELVAGERRWRAAKRAGLERVSAVVREVPEDRLLELVLIENIQREELNAIEEANALKNLIETIGLTQEALAERVGRDRSYVANYLRLLRLPSDLQQLVRDGKLSAGHARTLLGIDDLALQRRIARRIIDQGLSVRQTERTVRRLVDGDEKVKRSKPHELPSGDANVRAAENKLRRQLGTQVRIIQSARGAGGKIEIEFYSAADLDRLYRMILPADTASAGAAV